jgi:hypothetical protein
MVLAKAVEVTPTDTGMLHLSGHVKPMNGGKTQELSFGGPAAPYALIVHEGMHENHAHDRTVLMVNWSKAGTGPKYLETPLRENADRVLAFLNKATARALGG